MRIKFSSSPALLQVKAWYMKNKRIIAIIPARGGSKGLPRKNIKNLAGKPLIAWTIKAALKSKYLDRVIVSTEDEEIASISKRWGAEVVKRPKALATDGAKTTDAVLHVLEVLKKEKYEADIFVLLQPTSPLRRTVHIDDAIAEFLKEKCDSVVSVCPSHALIWKINKSGPAPVNYNLKKRVQRQDMRPEYKENGAVYVLNQKSFVREKLIPCGKIKLYVMPEEISLDIDTEFDLWLGSQIIKRNKKI